MACSSGQEEKIMSFNLGSKSEADHLAEARGRDATCRILQVLVHVGEMDPMFLLCMYINRGA